MNKPLTDDWNLKFQLQNLSNPFNKTFKYYKERLKFTVNNSTSFKGTTAW